MKSRNAVLWKISAVMLILALTLPISIVWARGDGAAPTSSEQTIQETSLLQTTITAIPFKTVNLRAKPSTSSKIIGSIPRDKKVFVLGRNSDSRWIYVAYGNKRGWIAGWLTSITGDLRNVPVTDLVGSTGNAPAAPTPIPCQDNWFITRYSWFATSAVADVCPFGPAVTREAAYQLFQHGAMIWQSGEGYLILPFDPSTDRQKETVWGISDPITAYRDTSASYQAPPGLFAPVSGFGIVWRGDNSESNARSLLKQLGWALTPEVGYTIIQQGGTSTFMAAGTPYAVSHTYLTLPDGRVIYLSRVPMQRFTTMEILPAQ